MKRFLFFSTALLLTYCSNAQITITAADMPATGDTLGYSNVSTTGVTISPGDSGANMTWEYELIPTGQGMELYRTPAEINPFLSFSLSGDLYGYKALDSIPFIGLLVPGISISDIYTFFEKITIPSCYVAAANAASISGIPLGTNYSEPDVWYKFPLSYGNVDSNYYSLNISLASTGSIKETGYRKNTVDGWGTIVTPYYTTPVNCIRVRSEIFENDSITFSGTTFGIPRNSVEYKWLVNGDHYPALWVTSSVLPGAGETVTSIKYRDRIPDLTAVHNTTNGSVNVTAFPNPSTNGIFTLGLPADWKTYHADVYNMQSRLVASQDNDALINIQAQPSGNYIVRVTCAGKVAFVPVVR